MRTFDFVFDFDNVLWYCCGNWKQHQTIGEIIMENMNELINHLMSKIREMLLHLKIQPVKLPNNIFVWGIPIGPVSNTLLENDISFEIKTNIKKIQEQVWKIPKKIFCDLSFWKILELFSFRDNAIWLLWNKDGKQSNVNNFTQRYQSRGH